MLSNLNHERSNIRQHFIVELPTPVTPTIRNVENRDVRRKWFLVSKCIKWQRQQKSKCWSVTAVRHKVFWLIILYLFDGPYVNRCNVLLSSISDIPKLLYTFTYYQWRKLMVLWFVAGDGDNINYYECIVFLYLWRMKFLISK